MLQLSLGLKTGIGLWTVSMGFTAFSGELFMDEEVNVSPSSSKVSKVSEAKDIKIRVRELPCTNNVFSKVLWGPGDGVGEALKSTGITGCLSVWWEKETYDNGNWKGSWSLLWTMRDNDYGIILSSNITADEGKLIDNTVLYSLKKKDQWSFYKSSGETETDIGKEIKKEDIEKKIVFPDEGKINASNGWAFDFKSDKICSDTNLCESENPTQTFASLVWNFSSEEQLKKTEKAYPIYEWVKNINQENNSLMHSIKFNLEHIKGYFELTS